jgi:hypothetical protein
MEGGANASRRIGVQAAASAATRRTGSRFIRVNVWRSHQHVVDSHDELRFDAGHSQNQQDGAAM